MKKNFSLFTFLFLSFLSIQKIQANYYPYESKAAKLSEASFKRYVVPQLKSISKEFYHIIVKLHPAHDSLIKLNAQGKSLVKSLNAFEVSCPTMKVGCDDKLKTIYKMSRNIDKTILTIQKYKVTFDGISRKNDNGLYYMKLIGLLDKIGNNNYKLMHYLEEYRLTANTNYSSFFSKKHVITRLIHDILVNTKMAMTGFLNENIQSDFEAVWFHFITPLEESVIDDNNKNFLVSQLENLNISWNTFHMKMTKGNFKLDKSITSIIKIMHNRWNSILKIILR